MTKYWMEEPQGLFLPLEPRMMFDGVGVLAQFLDDPGHDFASSTPDPPEPSLNLALAARDDRPPTEPPRREIVFIDAGVPDYQTLLAGAAPNRQIVVLDASQDGVERITDVLAIPGAPFDAIHIISHGSAGRVALGATTLSGDTLPRHAEALRGWGDRLTPDGDLLFYGCDIGSGTNGTAFIQRVAALTGADVAASDDITGATHRGGDWLLEQSTGGIETSLAVDAQSQQSYQGALATITVTSLADNATTNGLVTLREALTAANTDASVDGSTAGSGTDTILFHASLANGTITLTSELTISDNLVIEGSGNNITLSGAGGNRRALYVNMSTTSQTFNLNNITIDNFDPTSNNLAG
ncbi:MAG: DUF4347 domain-containing protein, partial [Magnetococcales bacterium]|nr:DUF4347 domain-containing protein [Magnetococcales bacterium]